MKTTKWTPRHETPEPLEANDVAITIGGTIVWSVLFLAQLPFYSWYSSHGHAWWIWSCAAGAGLGFVGFFYVRGRRDAILRSRRTAPDAGPGTDGAPGSGSDSGSGPGSAEG